MPYTPLLIADFKVGLEKDREPWILPRDAYPDLEDCYLFRGRVKKKKGYTFIGRLQRNIGETDGSGDASIPLPNTPLTPGLSQFIVGDTTYQDSGDGADPTTLLVEGTGTATLSPSTGVLTIAGGPISTAILYVPSLPVMGLSTAEVANINQNNLVAFDTSFAYQYQSSMFSDLSFYQTGVPLMWTGANYQLFWSFCYYGALWLSLIHI